VYAPGKIEDAKAFTEIIGKESVVKESLSTSGSRYAVALNNLNASSQEVARDLMNPDELMKLPPTEALILNQGMPPYIAKKVVYYQDKRFRDKAYSRKRIKRCARIAFLPVPFIKADTELVTGFPPPATRVELEAEIAGLPSAERTGKKPEPVNAVHEETAEPEGIEPDEGDRSFNPCDFIESYESIEDCAAPDQRELRETEPPPIVIPVSSAMFSSSTGASHE
jgi:type IV secretion system protein VirD4